MDTLYNAGLYTHVVQEEGRVVIIARLSDGKHKIFRRATAWAQADSYMSNITDNQMEDYLKTVK